MGNTGSGGTRHKSAKEEAAGRARPRASSASGASKVPGSSSPPPPSHHTASTSSSGSRQPGERHAGAVIIETPGEDRAEMLSRLIAEFESDRVSIGLRCGSTVSGVMGSTGPAGGGGGGLPLRPGSPALEQMGGGARPTSAPLSSSQTTPALSEVAAEEGDTKLQRKLQCMFKWAGGGRKVFLAGAFTDPPWQARIPMHRSKSSNFYTIYNLSVGLHDYCFVVDGQWRVDEKQPMHSGQKSHPCSFGGSSTDLASAKKASFGPPPQTNCLEVKDTDFEVFNALEADFAEASDRQKQQRTGRPQRPSSQQNASSSRPGSPPGDYTREVPSPARLLLEATDHPPLLPPMLLDGILNADTSAHYDPNLMPVPQHVMLNHLYCLSIKDGMMILASTSRYRKKFVSTVLYRPIVAEDKPQRRHSDKPKASDG